jgi:uncharacterized membrane protein
VTSIDTPKTLDRVPESVRFRWAYVALPVAVLVITVIITAIFYTKLPEETAYRFSGGLPVSWVSRNGFTAWAIGIQLIFSLARADG